MRLKFFFFIAIGLFCLSALAREEMPPWVATHGGSTGFPGSLFLTGFGMSSDDKRVPMEEKVTYAKNMALGCLASGLRVEISSEKVVNSFSSIVNGNEEMLDEFKARVVAKSELNIDGVQFRQYSDEKGKRAFALAYLDKEAAVLHYRNKFKGKIGKLVSLQQEGNSHLTKKDTARAREVYLTCEQVIGELEEIIQLQELLGDSGAIADEDMKAMLDVRTQSVELWDKTVESIEAAAVQLAIKLARQQLKEGRVQVNALMLDASHQYSQFSNQFRSILENEIRNHTVLKPMLAGEMDFTPESSNVARQTVVANGADYLLSGTYFIKAEEIHLYIRLSDVQTSELVATASVKMNKTAVGDLNLQPRNYVQALIDRKVFNQDEIIGGSLNLEVWTNKGTEGLVIEEDQAIKLFVRVNQVCYVRFIYHLCNGARIIPEKQFMNYYIDASKVNRVVELPEEFVVCAPFGTEIMQFFASTDMLPDVGIVTSVFDGEEYEVISDELAESNVRYRGIKKKKKDVEVTEKRISLTTVSKPMPSAK